MTYPGRAERLKSLNESIGKETAKNKVFPIAGAKRRPLIGGNGALRHADKPLNPRRKCAGPLCKKMLVYPLYCGRRGKNQAAMWRARSTERKNKKCEAEGCKKRFIQRFRHHRFCSQLCGQRERTGVIKPKKLL